MINPVACADKPKQLTAPAPEAWPTSSRIKRKRGQRQVVMFAEPYDFSAYESIHRAIDLCARSGASGVIVFVAPADASDNWFDSPVVTLARRNGLTIHKDRGSVEAARFTATHSGLCIAYDARGQLCFYGSLSPHKGEKRDAGVVAALQGISHTHGQSNTLVVRPVVGEELPGRGSKLGSGV